MLCIAIADCTTFSNTKHQVLLSKRSSSLSNSCFSPLSMSELPAPGLVKLFIYCYCHRPDPLSLSLPLQMIGKMTKKRLDRKTAKEDLTGKRQKKTRHINEEKGMDGKMTKEDWMTDSRR